MEMREGKWSKTNASKWFSSLTWRKTTIPFPYWVYLAQAISCMTEPKRRKVQLKSRPTFLQCFPRSPSSTSNHCMHEPLIVSMTTIEAPQISKAYWKIHNKGERESTHLNHMVSKINFFSLLSSSVLNIKYAYEISSPTPHQPIKQLKENSRQHPQLRERVRQREKHLGHLHSKKWTN